MTDNNRYKIAEAVIILSRNGWQILGSTIDTSTIVEYLKEIITELKK